MQDHLTCDDKEKEEVEEQLIENKVSFFNALQGLQVARKYIQQFDVEDHTLVTCSKIKNKLYILKHQEKRKQITILERQNKNEFYCFDIANDCCFMKFIADS